MPAVTLCVVCEEGISQVGASAGPAHSSGLQGTIPALLMPSPRTDARPAHVHSYKNRH